MTLYRHVGLGKTGGGNSQAAGTVGADWIDLRLPGSPDNSNAGAGAEIVVGNGDGL